MRSMIRLSAVVLIGALECACGGAGSPVAPTRSSSAAATAAVPLRSLTHSEDTEPLPDLPNLEQCDSWYTQYQISSNYCHNLHNDLRELNCELACSYYTGWLTVCSRYDRDRTLDPFVCG